MQRNYVNFLLPAVLMVGLHSIGACSEERQADKSNETVTSDTAAPARPAPDGDVVARVGDQEIRFSEINTMLNSSAVVGLSIPALGTPERDTVRIALLDKIVSANLTYLDALRLGVDKAPEYRKDMQRFQDSILADLYLQKQIDNDVTVSEDEIQTYFKENIIAGTEIDDKLRTSIESILRKEKFKQRKQELLGKVREGSEVTVYQNNFNTEGDEGRDANVPVAEYDDKTITWGEVKDDLIIAGQAAAKRNPLAMEVDARLAFLQGEIDRRLLADRARAGGLESDPVFQKRSGEYAKTRLINLHRARLVAEWEPTDEQLRAYYDENKAQIAVPEFRKVQMVMLETEDEAASLKKEIEAGDLTMYQAAADHSVAPDAKQNLGEIGWIGEGRTRPALDKVIFSLQPAEIGGPVEAGGLWHLVTVQDVRDAQNMDFDTPQTRKLTRRKYVHEKLDEYVVDLRKNRFPVEVYEDTLIRLAQQEADMVKAMAAKSHEPGSVTEQRVKELQKLLKQ
jgi:parvulin-like peptidyl-prolyl isomerase